MPQTQSILNLLEKRIGLGGKRQAVGFGYLERIPQRFPGNPPRMGIMLLPRGGLLGEGIQLQMHGLRDQVFDRLAGIGDFLANAPP